MPDDLGEVERQVLDMIDEHFRRYQTDPEYRKKVDADRGKSSFTIATGAIGR